MTVARSSVLSRTDIPENDVRPRAEESFRRLAGEDPKSIRLIERRTSGNIEVGDGQVDLRAAHLIAWEFEAVF